MSVKENIKEVTFEELQARKVYGKVSPENQAKINATYQNIKDVENLLGRRVVNLSDFDADGICSALIIKKIFPNCETIIGDRFKDGYGIPNVNLQQGDLVICTDIGSSDLEKINILTQQTGIAPFIVDHHEKTEDIKLYTQLNNSKVLNFTGDENAPSYCGTGLALKLYECHYVNLMAQGFPVEDLAKELNTAKVLGMIGTIADMVSVNNSNDENRTIIENGFQVLRDVYAGKAEIDETLRCFLEMANLDETLNNITTKKIGFDIAPLLNACGRLEEYGGQKIFNILSTPLFDENSKVNVKVLEGLEYIKEVNQKRKNRTDEIMHTPSMEEAIKQAKESADNVVVIVNTDIEQGLTGLVANKIKDTTDKPTIVLTEAQGSDGKVLVGSGRNMDGYPSLYQMGQSDLCIKVGGHEGAIGLSIHRFDVDDYRKELVEKYKNIDVTIEREYLKDWQNFTYEQYLALEPYGTDFPVPTICTDAVQIENRQGLPAKAPKAEWAFTKVDIDGTKVKFTDFGKATEWNVGSVIRFTAQPSYNEWTSPKTGKTTISLDYLVSSVQDGIIKELDKSNVNLPKEDKTQGQTKA